MSRCGSLLELIRGLLERTYRIRSGLGPLAPFVIGDRGFRLFYADCERTRRVAVEPGEAETLVRETGRGVSVAVYLPDSLIDCLETYPPQYGVGEDNIDAFATFIEEIDHLLVIAERARHHRVVTLFELELHANVSKELVLSRFLAGSTGQLDAHARLWLHHRLFERGTYAESDPAVASRYRDADRWAIRFLRALRRHPPTARLDALRRFHAVDASGKVELVGRLAA